MTTHGPTPVTAEPGGGRGSWIKDAAGNYVALGCGNTDAESEANSARVVLCYNAHDQLVQALDYVLERTWFDQNGKPHFKPDYNPEIVPAALRRAAGVTYG